MLSALSLERLGFYSAVLTRFVLRPKGANHWKRLGGTGNGVEGVWEWNLGDLLLVFQDYPPCWGD